MAFLPPLAVLTTSNCLACRCHRLHVLQYYHCDFFQRRGEKCFFKWQKYLEMGKNDLFHNLISFFSQKGEEVLPPLPLLTSLLCSTPLLYGRLFKSFVCDESNRHVHKYVLSRCPTVCGRSILVLWSAQVVA